jgi:hypothetical protein
MISLRRSEAKTLEELAAFVNETLRIITHEINHNIRTEHFKSFDREPSVTDGFIGYFPCMVGYFNPGKGQGLYIYIIDWTMKRDPNGTPNPNGKYLGSWKKVTVS